ncbi:hypothetical protein [Litchfieldia salsa]|uniref:Uncharacterized protein n=1 Tax=Litchfieldia salsa TaxID=930152 RepID=A0A1H0WCF4_9BACI|nr:hypothetical protein [Litchfieldia salsa]SDP87996.1 hypothetical protein SAMN05216565_11060 [Litchfieldia salsa]
MINENYDALLRASKDHETTYLGDHTSKNQTKLGKQNEKGKKQK